MIKLNKLQIYAALAIFALVEALSFTGFMVPALNQVLAAVLAVAAVFLTIYALEYGVVLVLGELFIGSMGHLFYLEICGFQLPVRILLWAAVMAVFLVRLAGQLIKTGKRSPYWLAWSNFSGRKYFSLLLIFVLFGLLNGWWRGHSPVAIFADFNAWLYFFFLWPLVVVYGDGAPAKISRLQSLFLAAAIWLSAKTLLLLFVFTHNSAWSPEIYSWLRRTLSGEMTPTKTGWPRVFIQGQIYSAIAFLAVFWQQNLKLRFRDFYRQRNLSAWLLSACFLSAILISFSRSFWVALVAAVSLSLLALWRRQSFGKMLSAAIWLVVSAALSFALIYLVVAFPYIQRPSSDFSSNFLARVSAGSGEAAVASRWSLLPVLWQEINREPFLGQGYGATVTYLSRDPRLLEKNPSGEYTTYAFEWGYLDLWLKLGLLGLLAYLWLLGRLVLAALRQPEETALYPALAAGLFFLALTHVFTPYLNHPLGIGFILLSSCLIWSNRVY
ncbi:MAG: O-antigen ligase family protein [Patescibacteria group bacterium]